MDLILANVLWTARWALKNNDTNTAYEQITKALEYIGAEKPAGQPAPTPPVDVPKVHEPRFITHPGVKYDAQGTYQTPSGKFEGLVVHYTVSGRSPTSARSVMEWMESQGYGCMVMDENGDIHIPEGWDIFTRWDDHAGVSKWNGRSSLSRFYAGMEICCWGLNSKTGPFREAKKGDGYVVPGKYQQYTEAQEKSLINFILWAKSKNPEFKIDNVVGHDEIRDEAGRPGDKQDPGASLSMTMPSFRRLLHSLD